MIVEDVSLEEIIKKTFDEELLLKGRSKFWRNQTKLYDNIPELDCITVVNILVSLEDNLNISIDYEDYNKEIFGTVKSLSTYIQNKVSSN